MSSFRRIISSQINGAQSHGPVTEEGKQRSSLNSMRHGLLAECTVNKLESNEIFDIVVNDHTTCFEPQNGVEEGLIEEMVSAHWRSCRLRAMENNMMDEAIDNTSPDDDGLTRVTDAFSSLTMKPAYHLLDVYEGRLHRRYHRAVNTMLTLQENRRRNEERKEKHDGQTNPV